MAERNFHQAPFCRPDLDSSRFGSRGLHPGRSTSGEGYADTKKMSRNSQRHFCPQIGFFLIFFVIGCGFLLKISQDNLYLL